MNTFEQTNVFGDWLKGLRDEKARARILQRIVSAQAGNFGDCGPVGAGVSEMRIHYGPGYRVYFYKSGRTVTC